MFIYRCSKEMESFIKIYEVLAPASASNCIEAGFLVACLARRILRWQARTFHSIQFANDEKDQYGPKATIF
jgi:hypothetical protein